MGMNPHHHGRAGRMRAKRQEGAGWHGTKRMYVRRQYVRHQLASDPSGQTTTGRGPGPQAGEEKM